VSQIPQSMQAMSIGERAGSYELVATRRPVPQPGPGEVLIEVYAAGVNGHDVHQIHNGGHALRVGETDLPGLEVAGRIVELGQGSQRWQVGDRVCALLRGGGYAEYAVAPSGNCLPAPENLSWAEAAVLPETFFTVWSNVFVDCALAPGETFLMNGGTSGIGVAAIQIAATLEHRVFATARGAEKAQICAELGAMAIDYETQDFPAVILEATRSRGVDVILDIVAGEYLEKDIRCLAEGGRVAFIGGARGYRTAIDLQALMRRRGRIFGSLLRPRSDEFKAQVAAALEARVWPHVRSGRIEPMLYQTFPLASAADAIRMLEERRHIGKVALLVRELLGLQS